MEPSKRNNIVLIGAGGHAKAIVDSIIASEKYNILGVLTPDGAEKTWYRSIPLLGNDNLLVDLFNNGCTYAAMGIGYMGEKNSRAKIFQKAKEIGFTFPPIVDPSAIIALDAKIDEGTYIGKGVVINANSRIGALSIVNSGSLVEHDCIVGDCTHLAVRSVLCGGVTIGNSAMVGANATIIQNLCIGDECIIGANATVLSNMMPQTKAIGVYKETGDNT